MNLINLFQKVIVDIGMKAAESSVFYEAPIGIRFDIGGEDDDVYIKKGISRKLYPNPDYVNKAVERVSKIFNALPRKDWILRMLITKIDLFPHTCKTVDMFPHTIISLKIANTSILSTRPMWSVWR